MEDLVLWLGQQLDEEQRAAEEALKKTTTTRRRIGGQWVEDTVQPPEWWRSAWSPARVLREIDSKRRTIIRCEEAMASGNPMLTHFAKQTVREMALPYRDRAGYAEALAAFE